MAPLVNAGGALAGCTSPPFLVDWYAPSNFENYINNVPKIWVQNKILNKAMHPCFQIPNAPAV